MEHLKFIDQEEKAKILYAFNQQWTNLKDKLSDLQSNK